MRPQAHRGPYLPPEEPQRGLATWLLVAAIIVAFLYFGVIAASWLLGVHG